MAKKITETERRTYEYVKHCIEELGYPPSVREICTHCNFKSTSTAHRAINSLTEKGLLKKKDNLNRAIGLAGSAGVKVPLVGKITPGVSVTDFENIVEYIDFNPVKKVRGELFAFKVSGDSMKKAAILDGDTVVAERTTDLKSGEIALVICDSGVSVMRFFSEGGHFRFQSESDPVKNVVTSNADAIIGRVIAVIRHI